MDLLEDTIGETWKAVQELPDFDVVRYKPDWAPVVQIAEVCNPNNGWREFAYVVGKKMQEDGSAWVYFDTKAKTVASDCSSEFQGADGGVLAVLVDHDMPCIALHEDSVNYRLIKKIE